MKRSRIIALCAALMMLFAQILPTAASASGERAANVAVTPFAGDGVTLEYDASQFGLRLNEQFGMYVVDETKTITLTARFEDGWTFNPDFTSFFPEHADDVTQTENPDGSVTFAYHAVKGDYISKDELLTVGVYATPAELPKLEITASVPFSQIDKETWVTASFSITLGTKQFESGNYEGTGSIKGRGNTSWGQPKKPYSIKLDSKASLLDIPKTKKYAIVPSYSDDSLLRNYMTYKAAALCEGIDYVPRCEFVEAYLNGVYNGIYLLVERVDIESNKIDIEEATAEELTGGYLIEKDVDNKIDFDSDQWFNCPYWANQGHDYFVLKTPEPDDPELVSQMLSYLTDYMQSLHDAVVNGAEPYTKYVDSDSWMDFMILQEIAKNIDGNLKTSCYMVKMAQDDKLYMTAPWDFDLAYGSPDVSWNNADVNHNDYFDCPDAQSYASFMVINSSCPWFDHLYDDHAEFREELMGRYAEYRRTLVPEMMRLLNGGAAYLSGAISRDEAKWGVRFRSGVTQLSTWLRGRLEWLDGQWLESETVDLNYALNTEGGHLSFTSEGSYPFTGVIKDGRIAAVSGNAGVDSSDSVVTLVLDMQAGDSISFDYKVSSEYNYDKLLFQVNNNTVMDVHGEHDWQTYTYTVLNAGQYTFAWKYRKDYSAASGTDCAWIDEIIWSGDEPGLIGDVNGDGTVDSNDALLLLRYTMGLIGELPCPDNADYDGDGSVTSNDALAILRGSLSIG